MVHGGISHVHPNWGNIDNKGKNGNNKFQKEKKKINSNDVPFRLEGMK
jgi:hypothetical protein